MAEKNDIARVVGALLKVPEKRLIIIDLANELPSAKGRLEYDKFTARQPEINLAVAEARTYGEATERAVNALKKLKPRAGESL